MTILSWALTIPTLLALIMTLLLWHPALALIWYIHRGLFDWLAAFGCRLLLLHLGISGHRIHTSGLEKLPSTGPIIVISNHQSFFDIPLFLWYLRHLHPRFISKKELGRGFPCASLVLRKAGSALIDRKNPAQAISEIQRCAALVECQNAAVVIFPEGSRSKDGRLRPFKRGGVEALLKAMPNASVALVGIRGSAYVVSKSFMPIPMGGCIELGVLRILARSNLPAIEELLSMATEDIQAFVNAPM